MSKDPILFGGADPNIYAYIGNDPINGTDSMGLREDPECIEKVDWECQQGCANACGGAGARLCAELCFSIAKSFCFVREKPRDNPECAQRAQSTYNYCMNVLKLGDWACSGCGSSCLRGVHGRPMNTCLCCRTPVGADQLCVECLRVLSAILLTEEREIVRRFWDVSGEFERIRGSVGASFRRAPFEPEAAMGCAIGLVRTGKIDHGLSLAACCIARDAHACWGCIAPGRVLADPVAMRLDQLDALRVFVGRGGAAP